VRAALFDEVEPDTSAAEIAAACRSETIPILVFTPKSGATPDERFGKLTAFLTRLQTRKLIFLHRPGGLRQNGALVPLINLSTEFQSVRDSRELSRKERALLVQSHRLVFSVPHKLVVTITSPLNLLRELFTVKGAGTLLRKGAAIVRSPSFAEVDVPRLCT